MRNFHDFFSEIYYSTKIPFNIKLNNNQEELKGDANMLKQCPNCHAVLKQK